METAPPAATSRFRIWDAPVRVFHWSLVALLGIAWWTAEQRMLDWHRLTGYAILTLLLFRVIWGLAGSGTARFTSFIRRPAAVVSYVRHGMFDRSKPPLPGHNPLGGWNVLLMLGLLFSQVFLGFFAIDIDGMESGPFSYLVDFDTGRMAAEWHEWVFTALQIIVLAHIAAVVFYLVYRRENLVGAMITGSRTVSGEKPQLTFAPVWRAVLVLLLCGMLVWSLVTWMGQV